VHSQDIGCQAVVFTELGDAEWECEERGGGGRGRRWLWRWGSRLLSTAREASHRAAPKSPRSLHKQRRCEASAAWLPSWVSVPLRWAQILW